MMNRFILDSELSKWRKGSWAGEDQPGPRASCLGHVDHGLWSVRRFGPVSSGMMAVGGFT
jgi:hypothetical protein